MSWPSVRVAVLEGLTLLVDNPHAQPVLKRALPQLAALLGDPSLKPAHAASAKSILYLSLLPFIRARPCGCEQVISHSIRSKMPSFPCLSHSLASLEVPHALQCLAVPLQASPNRMNVEAAFAQYR
eukprot:44671-Pelagomonas_calceolata.AAC.1